jgi:hypothetical protein
MASVFKIGTTAGGITSLDALGTPCPDPQPQFAAFRRKDKLGDMSLKGRGPQTIVWGFPMIEVAQITMLATFQSEIPIYIQSRKRNDTVGVFEVLMNWLEPKEDGEHMNGFYGYRSGLVLEFIVISEVT